MGHPAPGLPVRVEAVKSAGRFRCSHNYFWSVQTNVRILTRIPRPAAVLVGALLLCQTHCEPEQSYSLQLSFSSQESICYALFVQVESRAGGGSQRQGVNTARSVLCLRTTPRDPSVVLASFEGLAISTDFLHPAEVEYIRKRLSSSPLHLRVDAGALVPVDSSALLEMKFGGWDLYRVVGRTLPSMPHGPVRPGDTWEREFSLPLNLSAEGGTGHLFQRFVLDSVSQSDAERLAHISWTFTYEVETAADSSDDAVEALPRKGRGNGSAVVAIGARKLVSGRVDFQVPADSPGPVWREHAELTQAQETDQ